MKNSVLRKFIINSLEEDIGDGDHSSQACIPPDATGKARLLIKEEGLLAGSRVAKEVFRIVDRDLVFDQFIEDGSAIIPGDIAFHISGRSRSILRSERLVLNIMQRMSGIATTTGTYAARLKGLKTRILDTRKTGPGMRFLEKEAVLTGGGFNHRMGLYDMIMLKDNHIDYAGGIEPAISKTQNYLRENNLNLKVEIEARNLDDVKRILAAGGVDRIMLDNFRISDTKAAVRLIGVMRQNHQVALHLKVDYAECGVDFISVVHSHTIKKPA
jgi:nicotinate-nucleotide pyrophosphorylase (carboxylating)